MQKSNKKTKVLLTRLFINILGELMKVYCNSCKWSKYERQPTKFGYSIPIIACYHPNNIKKVDTPHEILDIPKKKCSKLNKKNNCSWFEEI